MCTYYNRMVPYKWYWGTCASMTKKLSCHIDALIEHASVRDGLVVAAVYRARSAYYIQEDLVSFFFKGPLSQKLPFYCLKNL